MRSVFITRVLRLASLILVGLILVIMHFLKIDQIGFTMQSKNGNVLVSAGSSPAILLWAVTAIALFVLLMVRTPSRVVEGVPARTRRILAFAIDFWLSVSALSSFLAFIPLWLEAERTGHFVWHFQRNYSVSSDNLSFISILPFVVLMVFYFAFPLTRGRQTVGCFIMRIRLTPPFGNEGRFTFRGALVRVFHAFVGLCTLWRGWGRDEDGRTWYDRETGCTVVLVGDE